MPKLTAAEQRFVKALVRDTFQILFARTRKNTGRFIPSRISIEPSEAVRMIRVNTFIAKALNWMGKKLRAGSDERAVMRLRIVHLRNMNRGIRETLLRAGRRGGFLVTGKDATIYFSTLELVHKAFPAIRMNYLQSSSDMRAASEEAGDRWWDIRSILNVGHLPTKPRPEHFGR